MKQIGALLPLNDPEDGILGTKNKIRRPTPGKNDRYGVFSWDIVENIVRGDSAFAKFYGFAPEVVDEGLPIEKLLERVAPEDLARVAERTHHCILTGAPFDETFSIHRPGMDSVTVSVYSNCFHRVGNVLTHCAGSIFESRCNSLRQTGTGLNDNTFSIFSKTGGNGGIRSEIVMAPFAGKPA